MRKNVLGFMIRGLVSCGFGPIVLAVIYLILQQCDVVDTLTVNQVCMGIFSSTVLAFIAGGINIVYQIERLPLMAAILIQGVVLYISYLLVYLINGWIESGAIQILVFTASFILGYLFIWGVIYFITERNTKKLNEKLIKKQQEK